MSPIQEVINADNIHYAYEYKDGTRSPALKGASLKINRGERWLLIGANGCGKSTMIGVMSGKYMPTQGKCTTLGKDAFGDTSLQDRVARIGGIWPDNCNWTDTVAQTAASYPNVDMDRFHSLCHTLHVMPNWRVDHCSSGMKRKIKVLLALLYAKEIVCLDEFSTDLDVVEREHVLNYLKHESEVNGMTIVYATHIFDNLAEFPTHVARMENGVVLSTWTIEELKNKSMQQMVYGWILDGSGKSYVSKECRFSYPQAPHEGADAVKVTDLKFHVGRTNLGKYSTAVTILEGAHLSIPKGSRVLLVGTNGCGKSSLLKVFGGKILIPKGACTMKGRDAYHDTKLSDSVTFSGGWWGETEWDLSVADVLDGKIEDDRQRELLNILDVNVEWRMNRVSCGQRKRIQLLVNLLKFKDILLLDEVTADLDVVQREEFLKFLYNESVQRGCTVIYCTHIYDGLDGWPTELVYVDALEKDIVGTHKFSAAEKRSVLEAVEEAMLPMKKAEWRAMGITSSPFTRIGRNEI